MRFGFLAFAAVVIAVGIAGYAIGAGGSSSDVILCAAKKGGALSLASGKGKCGKGEKKLTIAKQGPPGVPGAPGPQGAAGPPGSAALEPVTYVKPAVGDCAANPGTFCKSPPGSSGQWENLSPTGSGGEFEEVGFYKDASGLIHLHGSAFAKTDGAGEGIPAEAIFYLPPGYRPSHGTEAFAVSSCPLDSEPLADIRVRTNGMVATDGFCASLGGVSFHP